MKVDQTALRYWNFANHSFAANGATSLIFSKDACDATFPLVLTGDDQFYKRNNQKLLFDNRWRRELTSEEIDGISNDTDTKNVLLLFGRKLTHSGIAHTGVSWRTFAQNARMKAPS